MAIKKQIPVQVNNEEASTNVETTPVQNLSAFRNEMEKAARKLRKVTVHYNDPRDSHMVTSAAVQAANPYFALGKIIPLDMSIELEQGLCDTLSEALIQVHVPDEKNPGLMKSKMIKKYSVIYED